MYTHIYSHASTCIYKCGFNTKLFFYRKIFTYSNSYLFVIGIYTYPQNIYTHIYTHEMLINQPATGNAAYRIT